MRERRRERQRERQTGKQRQTEVFCQSVGFFTSSSTTRLYHGRAPRQSV